MLLKERRQTTATFGLFDGGQPEGPVHEREPNSIAWIAGRDKLALVLRAEDLDHQQAGSDDDRGVGYVEVWPVIVDDVDFEKVDDEVVDDTVV